MGKFWVSPRIRRPTEQSHAVLPGEELDRLSGVVHNGRDVRNTMVARLQAVIARRCRTTSQERGERESRSLAEIHGEDKKRSRVTRAHSPMTRIERTTESEPIAKGLAGASGVPRSMPLTAAANPGCCGLSGSTLNSMDDDSQVVRSLLETARRRSAILESAPHPSGLGQSLGEFLIPRAVSGVAAIQPFENEP